MPEPLTDTDRLVRQIAAIAADPPDRVESLTDQDRRVYQGFAAYAFDLPECWPSQALVARDLGLRREAVNRSVRRLTRAGWMAVRERRWGQRNYGGRKWLHNVYELLEPWSVSTLAARRIVTRAHRRQKRLEAGAECRRRQRRFGHFRFAPEQPLHTNGGVAARSCSCRSCSSARADRRDRSGRLQWAGLDAGKPERMSATERWMLRGPVGLPATQLALWVPSSPPV